jgi:hypothetical protein
MATVTVQPASAEETQPLLGGGGEAGTDAARAAGLRDYHTLGLRTPAGLPYNVRPHWPPTPEPVAT